MGRSKYRGARAKADEGRGQELILGKSHPPPLRKIFEHFFAKSLEKKYVYWGTPPFINHLTLIKFTKQHLDSVLPLCIQQFFDFALKIDLISLKNNTMFLYYLSNAGRFYGPGTKNRAVLPTVESKDKLCNTDDEVELETKSSSYDDGDSNYNAGGESNVLVVGIHEIDVKDKVEA